MDWSQGVVLITGASEGIGAACARLLESKGANLSLTALPAPGFQDDDTGRSLITTGDITSSEVRRRIVERTLARFGRIDILINNAGVGQYEYPSEADVEVAKRMFDINVFSALALTQSIIPGMRKQKAGVIVNIGSVAGRVSLPWAVMYCATKWATHCVSDSLRRELSPHGIRVVKVCPAIVNTRFRENVLAGKAPPRVKEIRRVVSPDQVAEAIVGAVEGSKRTVYVPKIGWAFANLEIFAPWLMDWYLRGKSQADAAGHRAGGGIREDRSGTAALERQS
jgi:short-subunit dehydrogenase